MIMDCSKLIYLFAWFGTGLFIILLPGNIFILLVTKLFCLGGVIMFLFTCSTNKYYTLTHFLVEEQIPCNKVLKNYLCGFLRQVSMWKFFVLCKTYLTQIMLLLERKVHFLLGLVPKVLAAREKTVR